MLALTLDVTLYRMIDGIATFDPPNIGALTGASIKTPEDVNGSPLAIIDTYSHPNDPGEFQPIAWCTGASADDFRVFRDNLPSSGFSEAVPVTILFTEPVQGTLIGNIGHGDYPDGEVIRRPVIMFDVVMQGTMQDPTNLGAAVVLSNNSKILVGMVLGASLQGEDTVLHCYPATEFSGARS
jgi:hypothetical protein